jgi:amino acid transporter
MSISTTPRKIEVPHDRGLRRDVGRIGLLFTSVGSIIGSGWLFSAFDAAQIVGPASIISWLLGGLMAIIVGLSFSELGVMFPVSGGVARYPQYAFGPFAGFTSGWAIWLAAVATVPIEVLASVQYATPYLPWLMTGTGDAQVLSGPGLGVSIALAAVFSLINVLGVKAFVRFNNVLVWWKLIIIVVVAVALIVSAFHPGNFHTADGFAPFGYDKVFSALPAAGIVFSFLGFRQGVEFAGETSDPRRNVPVAVIGSVVITTLIYVALQVAFVGALPGSTLVKGWAHLQYDNVAGPLAGLALLLGMTWLAVVLYADAVISPADTGLIYAGVAARLGYGVSRNGNAPATLARLNTRGVPWVSVLVMFVVGSLFLLPFPSWNKLVGFIVSGTVLSFGPGPLTVAALRRSLPDQERRFRLPGTDVLPFLAFACANLIVYWTGWTTNWKLFAAVLLGYVLFGAFRFARRGTGLPALRFHASWWILPWLGGLCLFSWIGHYDGGLDLLAFGVGELVIIVFSVVIYALAVRLRLNGEQCAACAAEMTDR